MITLYAGTDPHPFHIHRDVVCDSSPYFRARCSGTNLNNAHLVFRFPEIAPSDMRVFLMYLYRRFWKDLLMPAPEYARDLLDNVQLYLVSGVFGVAFLQGYAADVVAYLLERETKAYVFGLASRGLAAHLEGRMDAIRLVYEGTRSDEDRLRALLVGSVTAHMDEYYERGTELGLDMAAYMVAFERVPEFWRDLKNYTPPRKSGG